jgi:hypothetical protein
VTGRSPGERDRLLGLPIDSRFQQVMGENPIASTRRLEQLESNRSPATDARARTRWDPSERPSSLRRTASRKPTSDADRRNPLHHKGYLGNVPGVEKALRTPARV